MLKREQWDVAAVIDRPRSAQDLAWRHGLALYDVIERIGGLVQAGLCVVRRDSAAVPAPSAGTVLPRRDPLDYGRPAGPPRSAGPSRSAGPPQPGRVLRADGGMGADGALRADGHELAPAAPELLRRVLDGLKELS